MSEHNNGPERRLPVERQPEADPIQAVHSLAFQTALLDHIADAVIGLDGQAVINYWNKAAETLFGWKPEEVIGRRAHEVLGSMFSVEPGNGMRTGEETPSIIQENGHRQVKGVAYTRAGQALDLQAVTATLHGPDGELLGYAVTIHDLTEAKRHAAELHQKETRVREGNDRLNLALQAAEMVSWEWDLKENKVTYFGMVEEMECLKYIRYAEDWLTGLANGEHFDRQQMVAAAIKPGGSFHTEFNVQCPQTGEWFWGEAWGYAVTGEDGQVIKLVGVAMDITQRKQAEHALRLSQEKAQRSLAELHSIYIAAPVGLCFIDTDLRVQAINDWLARLMGFTVEEVTGKHYRDLLRPEVFDAIAPFIQRVLESGEAVLQQEIAIQSAAAPQERHTWIVSLHPVQGLHKTQDESGSYLGVSCVVQDFTERKRIEEQIRANQEDLARAQAVAQTGSWRLDVRNNALVWSDETYHLFGIPPSTPLTYEKFLSTIHPEDRDYVNQRWEAALHGEPYDIEHRILADSTVKWVRERAELEFDAQGALKGGFGTVQDVTERKQAQLELQESQERFRASVESLMDGFSILSAVREDGKIVDFRYEFINEAGARMNGRPANEIVGRNLLEIVPSMAESERFERYVRLVETGEPVMSEDEEYEVVPGAGKRLLKTFDVRAAKLGDGIVVTWRDISPRKKNEEQIKTYAQKLEQSNHELEQFAFVASHDLQEPLRKIKLFGNSLRRKLGKNIPEEAEDYLNRLQKAAERMSAMINGLLELSRVNTHGSNFELINLTPIAADVVSDLEARLLNTRGQVILDELPTAEVDILQVRLLLQNLIGNALKFHKENVPPVVEVSGALIRSSKVPMVVLSIKDNGIGLEEQYADRIFQPFQRLHGVSEYEGTGMGLAICQKIVERHRGRIEVHSAPGKGSTFLVYLPIQQGY